MIVVRFLVNQVGDDAKAALFLDGLQNISKEKKYKDLLHVTSGQFFLSIRMLTIH